LIMLEHENRMVFICVSVYHGVFCVSGSYRFPRAVPPRYANGLVSVQSPPWRIR